VTVVVGVHGIAQQQFGRHLLQHPWAMGLAGGLERAAGHRVKLPELDIAFYGDVFVDGPLVDTKAAGGGRAGPETGADEAGVTEDDVGFVLDAAGEILTSDDLAKVDAEPDKFPAMPTALLRVVAAIDRRLGHRAGALFVGELSQARRYLTDPEIKARVDARIAETVTTDCRVLIGHSLGSIVALEHLRLHPEQPSVDLFLTLGSPLRLRAIQHLLPDPDFGTGADGPARVRRWVNLRDPRDPIALAGGLAPWWPVVADDNSIDNGRRDAHAATHYLSKRQTGAAALAAVPDLGTPS
jgi:hypothetical protein